MNFDAPLKLVPVLCDASCTAFVLLRSMALSAPNSDGSDSAERCTKVSLPEEQHAMVAAIAIAHSSGSQVLSWLSP